jgi:hypothetical protein
MSGWRSRPRTALAALVAVLAVMSLGAASAQGAIVKLTGSSTVTPSEQAKQFLANNGVEVRPTGQATFANGVFTFPIAAGFGDTATYDGVLAHAGGLRFSKGYESAVVRRPVAVRAGDTAVLLAQLPGLSGNCTKVKRALRRYAAGHPGVTHRVWHLANQYPRAARRVVRALKGYCSEGRVIVLARLTNLGKSVENGTATLSADLRLSRQAARIINGVAGSKVVAGGAPLGSAVSTVTPAP